MCIHVYLYAQGPNKKPDPETDIQKMLLESLQLLGQKRAIREEMRKQKVYPICRNLDYLQDDEDISSIIFEIVQLTMGDEDPNTPVDDVVKAKVTANGTDIVEGLSDMSMQDKSEKKATGDEIECSLDDDCSLDGVD